jgi:tetratricopeptide (TPR) repeat protein
MKRFASMTAVAVLAWCATAAAQDGAQAQGQGQQANQGANFQAISTAKTLFDQGQKQMADKNYAAACASFKASNEAVARVGTLLNLADCYEKAGKLASAWGAYYDSINLGRRQGHPEYEEFAQKKKDELEPKLLKMTIVVPPDVKLDGMKVMRDKTVVEPAAWGVPVAVDPGKHSIDVTAPHKLAFHTDVTVDDAHKLVEVKIEKLADAPVAWPHSDQPQVIERVVQAPSAWTPLRIGGIALGGAGVVSIVIGSVLGLVANDKYQSALKNECNSDPNGCTPGGVSDGAAAHDLAGVATGLFVGGLIAVAGGITLFVVGAPSHPKTENAVGLRVTPLPGGASATLGGTF